MTNNDKVRKFWINYSIQGRMGLGEGDVVGECVGPVTQIGVSAWRDAIAAANDGASIVIRAWTELEG